MRICRLAINCSDLQPQTHWPRTEPRRINGWVGAESFAATRSSSKHPRKIGWTRNGAADRATPYLTSPDPEFLPSTETDAGSRSNDGTAYHGTPEYQRFSRGTMVASERSRTDAAPKSFQPQSSLTYNIQQPRLSPTDEKNSQDHQQCPKPPHHLNVSFMYALM